MFGGIVFVALLVTLAQAMVAVNLNAKLKFSGKYQVYRISVDNTCYVRPLMEDEATCSAPVPDVQVLRYDLQNLQVDELMQRLRPDVKAACEGLPIRLLLPKAPALPTPTVQANAEVTVQKRCLDGTSINTDAVSSVVSSLFGWWWFNQPAVLPTGR